MLFIKIFFLQKFKGGLNIKIATINAALVNTELGFIYIAVVILQL